MLWTICAEREDMTERNIQKVQARFMELFERAIRTSAPIQLPIKGKYKEDNIISKSLAVIIAERAMHQVNKELLMSGCPYADTWECPK